MSKYIVLATVVLGIVCFLQVIETRRAAGEGFCYKKISKKTGECKGRMKQKQQKVDCCSNGGAGWSARKRGRASCEPCRSIYIETSYWSDWGVWSNCNATCGPSFQVSNRTCISKGGKPCRGRGERWKPCSKPPCPIDGGWSPWGNWSRCSKTCGTGYQIQTRTCTNPVPQYGGKDCQGQLQQSRNCEETKHCPIDGGWGDWGDWSGCSLTCGLGKRTRERKCDNPKPQYGGKPCNESERTDYRYCREQRCREIDYSGDFSGSGDNWGSGSGSGSGSSGSGSGWEEIKAWRDNDDEDY